MNIVALLTGRGNNTLKDKNILPVLGKPLLHYPCRAARGCDSITHYYVSSDDQKILDAAKISANFEPIIRPESLGRPESKHIDVIHHAIDEMRIRGVDPDIVVVLLANSATLKAEWIESAIQEMIHDESITAMAPCYQEQDHHPYRAKRIDENGFLDTFVNLDDIDVSSNRQELETCVFFAHNFWVLRVKNSLEADGGQKPWVFMGDKVKPIMVEGCFDVHTVEDINRTEIWIKENSVEKY
jgi:CMP-N-acetylneuraminic acid synthetase